MTRRVTSAALALAALAVLVLGRPAPAAAQAFPPGAVVALAGTPHLWIAGEDGLLHWAGDTRALAGRTAAWGSVRVVPLEGLLSLRRGDPWLSAGLLKLGDPIYLVKWETRDAAPTLLHIQSIADVELFGITGRNYGEMVLDQSTWERRHSLSAASLPRGVLASAATGQLPRREVVLADDFADPSRGWLPRSSHDPLRFAAGYEGGEYALRQLDTSVQVVALAVIPGLYADAYVTADARLLGESGGQYVALACRSSWADGRTRESEYRLSVDPEGRRLAIHRFDAGVPVALTGWVLSDAINRSPAWNRLQLACTGDTIAATINGFPAISVRDSTHRAGALWVGAGPFVGGPPVDTRLDNLVVERG